ncbi:DNA-binding response regulator [Mucilaginibacter conchicola]|uniref:DNA-binding response regulator n=1 Tax=Mucilaginibacter conchicola TaxID=2303333 RepID=A0A372NLR6_9SPHI|nr:LytTR family DNA-binding domain-containing protein [Mucilaginibacter conchicola]RFZ89906.1 DNA-binding response regulator [Mucilaginibacter conchicola]
MINCLIVDDEPLAREIIARYIAADNRLRILKACGNAAEAFDCLHIYPVDLLFLDIRMPGVDGISFLRSLRAPPAVIFTTAFSEHALTGFELEAVDYLLKPITKEKFDRAISKFLKIVPQKINRQKDYTYFKVSGRLIKIHHADLLYVRAVKDYVSLCTINGNYLCYMTMKYLNEMLPDEVFVRVHRSFIVNKNAVETVERNALKIRGEMIPIGAVYRNLRWQ